MSNVLKGYVFHRVETLIENEMISLCNMFNVPSGDISPMQTIALEKLEKDLSSLLCIIMEQNFDEKFEENDEDALANVSIHNLLRAFLKNESEFRLKEIFELPSERVTESLVEDVTEALHQNYDSIFNYDTIDSIIDKTLREKNVQY